MRDILDSPDPLLFRIITLTANDIILSLYKEFVIKKGLL
jgi:hypothetical protein